MLPHHDHVRVHPLAQLPQLIHQYLVPAVRAVAHYHVLRKIGHVVIRLLAVFRGVLLSYLLFYDHRQHICQRHDAPAVHHPVEHVYHVLRLHAPHDAPVPVLRRHHRLFLIAAAHVLHYLFVYRRERGGAAAVAHIVRVVIQRERRADELRIRRAVHLQPRPAVARRLVDALGALEIRRPVPLFAGLLLYKGDGVLYVLRGVFLYVLFLVAHRRNELEGRDAVLPLKPLCDYAVAHQRAVAGRVHLHRAFAQHGEVVVDGDTRLGLRHGAHVARNAELLRHIEVVRGGILVQKVCREHRGHLAQDGVERREAHHERRHGVFVRQHALF